VAEKVRYDAARNDIQAILRREGEKKGRKREREREKQKGKEASVALDIQISSAIDF